MLSVPDSRILIPARLPRGLVPLERDPPAATVLRPTLQAIQDPLGGAPMFHRSTFRSRTFALATAALLGLAGCHDHGTVLAAGAGTGGEGSESVDQSLVDQLRGLLTGTDVGPIPAPPVLSSDLVDLGRDLFHDVEISGNRDLSCATCHLASLGGADGRTLSRGVGGVGLGPDRVGGAIIPRNSPGLFNLHVQTNAFWDGRVELRSDGTLKTPAGTQLTEGMRAAFPEGLDVIAAQAMFPPTSRDEMRGALGENELANLADDDFQGMWSGLMARLLSFPHYVDAFERAYPGVPQSELTFAHAAGAIAAFEVTEFYRPNSRFQTFLAGDDLVLSNAELRGGIAFFDSAGCINCHRGPLFSDFSFHNIGMPQLGPGKGDGIGQDDDFGRERVNGDPFSRYAFRTPALVGIGDTAPYGHAGQFRSLRRMTAHYRNPSASVYRFYIEQEVLDPELLATQVHNQPEVLQNLSGLASFPIAFNSDELTQFMLAL